MYLLACAFLQLDMKVIDNSIEASTFAECLDAYSIFVAFTLGLLALVAINCQRPSEVTP